MARYDREILVPYLQNICALHFAELEVASKMFETQKRSFNSNTEEKLNYQKNLSMNRNGI